MLLLVFVQNDLFDVSRISFSISLGFVSCKMINTKFALPKIEFILNGFCVRRRRLFAGSKSKSFSDLRPKSV